MNTHRTPTFLLSAPCCPPDCQHSSDTTSENDFSEGCIFKVAWSINPHMKVGSACSIRAMHQHTQFSRSLKDAGAQVITLPFLHGAYDSVFIKDSTIVRRSEFGVSALIANPFHKERRIESERRRFNLKKYGAEIAGHSRHHLEGGDIVVSPSNNKIFMGYGFRTDREAAVELSHFFDSPVIPLELKDPHFYHLDVALSILSDGTAFACREAFTDSSWNLLKSSGLSSLIQVNKEETMRFGLNWVEVGDTIVMGSYLPRLTDILKVLGKKVHYSPLDQFQLAGGSAACLVSRVYDVSMPIYQSRNSRYRQDADYDIVLSS